MATDGGHAVKQGFDTVIIGAGSAGGVLAARLSEDPSHSVLLVDAGPDFADPESVPPEIVVGRAAGIGVVTDIPSTPEDYLWRFGARVNAAQGVRRFVRGRLVGGSSTINGQVFIPALPGDFDRWVALGNDRWSYADVEPFYRAVLDVVGRRRYPEPEWCPPAQAFYATARAHGFGHCADDHDPDDTGVGPASHNNAGDVRQSVLLTYLRAARGRANLTIRPRSIAQRVVIENGRAVGVELAGLDGTRSLVRGERIVLSAGALASPQLLMLSGVGPADHLGSVGIPVVADRPGVGANLGEHPYVHLLWRARSGMAQPTTNPGHPVVLRYTSPGSPLANDVKMYMHNSVPLPPDSPIDPLSVVGSLSNLEAVQSKGRLRLSSASVADEPDLDFALLDDPDDLARMVASVRLQLDLLRAPEMTSIVDGLVTEVDEADLPGWVRSVASPAMHPCGTAAMGRADAEGSVVDQECRVHGVDGLWVVDASVMPEVPRANLNMTVMMLGERVATFLC
ncbi:MAG: choline dehydrogenase [Pseudonocardiales bacterium]|nr:choline dehydrogenase [Pseudonocardiales bacterium]